MRISMADMLRIGLAGLLIVPVKGDEFIKFRKKARRMNKLGKLAIVGENDEQFVYKTTSEGESDLLFHDLKQALRESNNGI